MTQWSFAGARRPRRLRQDLCMLQIARTHLCAAAQLVLRDHAAPAAHVLACAVCRLLPARRSAARVCWWHTMLTNTVA